MTDTCETCTYMYDDTPGTHRECRRYPPVLLNKLGTAMFPVIRKTDWCGEYSTFISEELRERLIAAKPGEVVVPTPTKPKKVKK